MFESLEAAPPDPILGLSDAFKNDAHPNKINLTVGVYKDETGNTPILSSVKKAEERRLEGETTKSYLPIEGSAEYGRAVQGLLFGEGHEILASGRAATAHTPGGTGALRVAAEFIGNVGGKKTLWLSDPSWPNHKGVFGAAGFTIKTYPYYDASAKRLDFDGMVGALGTAEEGDVLLLHGCCHNPSGMDPTPGQWTRLAALAQEGRLIPLFDFAYQGFGTDLGTDAAGLRQFCNSGRELFVASSYSKNFGLYRERVGALTLVTRSEGEAKIALSHLKSTIRTNYSNPPAHGAAIVTAVLTDPDLRAEWEGEVAAMCARINRMRQLFVDTLKELGVQADFSFLAAQNGMFSFSGLTKEQVLKLRSDFGIYAVDSGRINVAGITESNMKPLCEAIASVL